MKLPPPLCAVLLVKDMLLKRCSITFCQSALADETWFWICFILQSVAEQKIEHVTSIRRQFSGSAIARICCTRCRTLRLHLSKFGIAFALPILQIWVQGKTRTCIVHDHSTWGKNLEGSRLERSWSQRCTPWIDRPCLVGRLIEASLSECIRGYGEIWMAQGIWGTSMPQFPQFSFFPFWSL